LGSSKRIVYGRGVLCVCGNMFGHLSLYILGLRLTKNFYYARSLNFKER